MSILTRDEILSLDDITVKEITFPTNFSSTAWQGKKVYIRQLNREEQDAYLRRQFGGVKVKQQMKGNDQEISAANIYGHDAWLVMKGVCDAQRNPIFVEADLPALSKKNGEAIGWLAMEIVKFSGMAKDTEKSAEQKTEDAVKNS